MSKRVKSGKLDDVISLPERKHVKFNPQLCREHLIYSKLKPYFLSNPQSSTSMTCLLPPVPQIMTTLIVLFSLEVTKVNSTVSSHVGLGSFVWESRPLSQPASQTRKTRHKSRCFWETQTRSRPPQAVNRGQGQIPSSHLWGWGSTAVAMPEAGCTSWPGPVSYNYNDMCDLYSCDVLSEKEGICWLMCF